MRKLNLGTGDEKGAACSGGEHSAHGALFSPITPYPAHKDGEKKVGSEDPPETGCLCSDKKLCHLLAVFL